MINSVDDIHRLVDARVGLVSVKPESVSIVPKPRKHHKRVWAGVGAFLTSLTLGMSLFLPLFDKRSGLDIIMDNLSDSNPGVVPVGEDVVVPVPFLFEGTRGMGTMPHRLVNWSFVEGNTVYLLTRDGVDVTSSLDVNFSTVFTERKYSYSFTAGSRGYFEFTLVFDSQALSSHIDTKNHTVFFNYSKGTIFYNFSDIWSIVGQFDSSFDLTDGVFTMVLGRTCNKNVYVSLDPVYGTIGDAVIDSHEFEPEEAFVYSPFAFWKLGTSQYYVTCAFGDTGTDYDGFLRILKVYDNNASIAHKVNDVWEYDTSDGISANMLHISGDVYAVCYADAAIGTLFTTKAYSSNGTLRKTVIDTVNLDLRPARYPNIVHVGGDIYAIVYQESAGGYDHWIETFSITSDGVICADALDTEEFDTTSAANTMTPSSCMVDGDTIAVAWEESVGDDCWMMTYNISDSTGLITDAPADSWEFTDVGYADNAFPFIKKINDNIFAVSYADSNGDGNTGTIQISDEGNIVGSSWIDSLEWETVVNAYWISMYTVNDASTIPGGQGVYGVTFGASGDNVASLTTFNISSDGSVGASIIDTLDFDAASTHGGISYYAPMIGVATNYYVIIYQDLPSVDGWVCTVEIETYTAPAGGWSNVCPIAKGEHPSNSSTNVVLKPAVGCTITDSNSNHTMNVTFATNSSGTWHNFQTNTSVANNSAVNWTMSMAGTGNAGYSWRVYVHDGFCNASYTFKFKTVANVSEGTWQVVDDTIDGVYVNVSKYHDFPSVSGKFLNTTVFKIVGDSGIDGQFANISEWVDYGDFSGSFFNQSKYHDFPSISGSFFNSSIWHDYSSISGKWVNSTVFKIVDSSINGVFQNISEWVSYGSVDGSFTNSTVFKPVGETGINGEFTNTSIPLVWHNMSWIYDGVFLNTTVFKIVDDTISGNFFNQSKYHDFPSISGKFLNTTVFKIVNSTVNGSFTNSSLVWYDFPDYSGDFYNQSKWVIINSTVNGSFTNTSGAWSPVGVTTINGRFINYTGNATGGSVRMGYSIGTVTGIMVMCGSLMVIIPLFLFKRRRRGDRY